MALVWVAMQALLALELLGPMQLLAAEDQWSMEQLSQLGDQARKPELWSRLKKYVLQNDHGWAGHGVVSVRIVGESDEAWQGHDIEEVFSETCRSWMAAMNGAVEVIGDHGEPGSRKDHDEGNVGDGLNGDGNLVVDVVMSDDVMECEEAEAWICVARRCQYWNGVGSEEGLWVVKAVEWLGVAGTTVE